MKASKSRDAAWPTKIPACLVKYKIGITKIPTTKGQIPKVAASEISAFVVFAAFFYAQIALLRPYLPWYLRHVIVCI